MFTIPLPPEAPHTVPIPVGPPPPPPPIIPGLDLINKIFDSVMVLNVKVAPFPSLLLRETVLPPSPYFLIVANSVDVRWA